MLDFIDRHFGWILAAIIISPLVALFYTLYLAEVTQVQLNEYEFDVYSPSGNLFTVTTVRSYQEPLVRHPTGTDGSVSSITTISITRNQYDNWRTAVTLPSGWLVLKHGAKLGND